MTVMTSTLVLLPQGKGVKWLSDSEFRNFQFVSSALNFILSELVGSLSQGNVRIKGGLF